MVNLLNKKICEELTELFNEANDCVLVNFQGMSVEEVNDFRVTLTHQNINMQVVRSNLSNIVLKGMNRSGYEAMLEGPTAIVWGGDGIIQISKSVSDFAKKTKKKLQIKGGFLNADPIDVASVAKLTTVPDRPVLLGSIVMCFMDPLQGITNGLGRVLSSIADLINVLSDKKKEEG